MLVCLCVLVSELAVRGVLDDTRLVGLQYSVAPPAPHGLPVLVSFHFSFSHRLSDVPASVLRTFPLSFLHFAIAWLARAEGNFLYVDFTLL